MMTFFLRKRTDLVGEVHCLREVGEGKDAAQAFDPVEVDDVPVTGIWGCSSAISSSVTVGASLPHATQLIRASVSVSPI
jgi:hypothetical protein